MYFSTNQIMAHSKAINQSSRVEVASVIPSVNVFMISPRVCSRSEPGLADWIVDRSIEILFR